jgi:transposase
LAFSNNESGFLKFKAWTEDIPEKHGEDVVISRMEPAGHYWFALGEFLKDNGMKPVHLNPYHVKKSKELDDNNPNKNDCTDPKTIASLLKKDFPIHICQLVSIL